MERRHAYRGLDTDEIASRIGADVYRWIADLPPMVEDDPIWNRKLETIRKAEEQMKLRDEWMGHTKGRADRPVGTANGYAIGPSVGDHASVSPAPMDTQYRFR